MSRQDALAAIHSHFAEHVPSNGANPVLRGFDALHVLDLVDASGVSV
jgi:hypothetical protein